MNTIKQIMTDLLKNYLIV